MKNVQEAVNYRYSARNMNATKKVNNHDINLIIEAGIKAPSGFGAEPWKFLIIDGNKESLKDATFNQPTVQTCSHLIVFLYATEKLIADHDYMRKRLSSLGMSEEKQEEYHQMILKHASGNYMKEQTFFAASQMSLQAAGLGIDSLLMGGFNPKTLAEVLEIDQESYAVSLIMALGYNDDAPKKRVHRDIKDIVEFKTL